MSTNTRSNMGRCAAAVGGWIPHWLIRARIPNVLSATVLPPALGPLMTSARSPVSGRSIGTAVAGSSSGWRARSNPTSPVVSSTTHPFHSSDSAAHPTARSICATRATASISDSATSPTAWESRASTRSTSMRSPASNSRTRLLASRTSSGSMNTVWPEAERSWTIPGNAERDDALTASTGRPARWVMNPSCRCSRARWAADRRASVAADRAPTNARRVCASSILASSRTPPCPSSARSMSLASRSRVTVTTAPAISANVGATSAWVVTDATISLIPRAVAKTSPRRSTSRMPPRAATIAAGRTSQMPDGTAMPRRRNSIASAVRRWRSRTSAGSGLGAMASATSRPATETQRAARRARTSSNSSSSSPRRSIALDRTTRRPGLSDALLQETAEPRPIAKRGLKVVGQNTDSVVNAPSTYGGNCRS